MDNIKVTQEKCTGCRACVRACPFNAIKMVDKKALIMDNCTQCRTCSNICKFGAIVFEENPAIGNTDQNGDIWVFAELKDGMAAKVVLELVNEGRILASKLEVRVCAILLGHNVEKAAQALLDNGTDVVYVVDNPILADFSDERYSKIIIDLVKRYKPGIFLIGATVYGRSLAPRISSALDTGLTADCTGLDIDPERKILLQTRPAFGGDLMATIITPCHRPQMATVRPGVFKACECLCEKRGKIIKIETLIPDSKTEILPGFSNTTECFDITKAEIIVSAGRGIGDKENLKLVEELALLIGGVSGASRAIVDAGWMERSRQVGQSGNTVSPKLYIACGISGAIQHRVGINSSSVIIAINKDADAPIMKIANYAFVGDAAEILRMLISEIRSLQIKSGPWGVS